jgi:hypothetical protein
MNLSGVSGICASTEAGDLYIAKGTLDDRSAAILAQVAFTPLIYYVSEFS